MFDCPPPLRQPFARLDGMLEKMFITIKSICQITQNDTYDFAKSQGVATKKFLRHGQGLLRHSVVLIGTILSTENDGTMLHLLKYHAISTIVRKGRETFYHNESILPVRHSTEYENGKKKLVAN